MESEEAQTKAVPESAVEQQPQLLQENSEQPGPEQSAEVSSQSDLDQTLAQQLADNEQEMYEQSRKHIEEIENEVRQTQPLVSCKQEIVHLVALYDPQESPEFFRKASELAEVYSHIRRIRGDGNCFYRAVLTSQLERCFSDRAELDRFLALCKEWRGKLMNFGFPELTTTDFCEAIETLLESIKNEVMLPAILYDDLNVDNIANYYVAFFRLISSGYLRENEALYSGFIEGGKSIDQYCKDEIEPMWKDCDHMSIIALVNAIGVPIRIEYMDQSQAPDGGRHYDFLVEGKTEPCLYFLYRPGHYDLLYRKVDPPTPLN